MPRPYRKHLAHGGSRIIQRDRGGRFRETTLGDLNLGTAICPECGALNPYPLIVDLGQFVGPGEPPTECSQCGTTLPRT